jgi:hypothetical protein
LKGAFLIPDMVSASSGFRAHHFSTMRRDTKRFIAQPEGQIVIQQSVNNEPALCPSLLEKDKNASSRASSPPTYCQANVQSIVHLKEEGGLYDTGADHDGCWLCGGWHVR